MKKRLLFVGLFLVGLLVLSSCVQQAPPTRVDAVTDSREEPSPCSLSFRVDSNSYAPWLSDGGEAGCSSELADQWNDEPQEAFCPSSYSPIKNNYLAELEETIPQLAYLQLLFNDGLCEGENEYCCVETDSDAYSSEGSIILSPTGQALFGSVASRFYTYCGDGYCQGWLDASTPNWPCVAISNSCIPDRIWPNNARETSLNCIWQYSDGTYGSDCPFSTGPLTNPQYTQ